MLNHDDHDDMISVDSSSHDSEDNSDSDYIKILKEIRHSLKKKIVLSNTIQPLFSKLQILVCKFCTERAKRIVAIILNYIRLDSELKDKYLVAVKELFRELFPLIYEDMQDTASDSPIEEQLHHLCQSALTLKAEELCDKLRHLCLSLEKIREERIFESDKLSLLGEQERKKLEDQLKTDHDINCKMTRRLWKITNEGCIRTLQISGLTIMRTDIEKLVYLIRYQNASIDIIREQIIRLTKYYFHDYNHGMDELALYNKRQQT
ncbi:MAG: hypothetical protein WD512_20280 [Candidatus Paceibacterota bacterium]